MSTWALTIVGIACALPLYAYVGYPAILRLIAARRPPVRTPDPPAEWPPVSIVLAAFNEDAQIRETLESLLALDYPSGKRQILVVSDASIDRTDAIVAEFAGRGVELLRIPRRVGKTAAENAALTHLRGEIIINTDASARIHPAALKALVTWFEDPEVGLASGCDVSVGEDDRANDGESGYVDYEMRLRELETRVSGIVGASGCLYAIRADLHRVRIPEHLSRDFMAALNARERGFRAVSAGALCFVPRAASLRREHRRKVRTMIRGIQTLLHKRHLLDPSRYGVFAWMLVSHKLCRWLAAWAMPVAAAALAVLAPTTPWAAGALAGLGLGAGLAGLAWCWPAARRLPRLLALPGYLVLGNLAACRAGFLALKGRGAPVWEPTRRTTSRRGAPA